MAALRMITSDQADRLVLDFYRCAMLPASPDWNPSDGPGDDLSGIGADAAPPASDPTAQWDGEIFRQRVPGPHFDAGLAGAVLHSTGDLVTSAPELARLTLNIAATHHDWRVAGQRLVYGGHTIGLALAQASRLLPNLVTVLGWESCDHTGPVHEGDTLYSELHVETAEATDHGGVLGLRSLVYAVGSADEPDRQVLDWRFSALQF
jgi:acyl dehydratase